MKTRRQLMPWTRKTKATRGAALATAILLGLSCLGSLLATPTAAAIDLSRPVLAQTSVLPAVCAPSAALATQVRSVSTGVADPPRGASLPKGLQMQPNVLTRPQWISLLDLARRAGVTLINVNMGWAAFEPNGPGSPDFSPMHQFVSDARDRGIAVRFQLTGLPQWARSPGDPSEALSPTLAPRTPEELALWAGWVQAVVASFATSVRYYEIWNEENIQQFWPTGPNPAQYARLLACSYDTAKSIDSAVTVMSGGLSTNDVGYLEHLYAALDALPYASSMRHFFDVLGVHPYSNGRSPAVNSPWYIFHSAFGEDNANFLGFRAMHAVLAAHGEAYKQLYLGEFGVPVQGYPLAQASGFAAVPAPTRARWVVLSYELAARSPYVAGMEWYNFYPDPWDGLDWALVRNPASSTSPTTHWATTTAFDALASLPDTRSTSPGALSPGTTRARPVVSVPSTRTQG